MRPIRFTTLIAIVIAVSLGIVSLIPVSSIGKTIIIIMILITFSVVIIGILREVYSTTVYKANTHMYLLPNIVREGDVFMITKMKSPTPKSIVKIVRASKMYENGIIINYLGSPSIITCPKEYLLTREQVVAMKLGLYSVPKAVTLISTKKTKIKDE